MTSLNANISSVCPEAFSGAAGELFLTAVTSLIAAQCTIMDDGYKWPEDRAGNIIDKSADGVSYDFIVVGAGTAGSLLASRLSHLFPSWSLLLIEAGDDPGIATQVPSLIFLSHDLNTDWRYTVKPDNRSCLSFENSTCIWSKGRCMGGTSSINAMIYLRGHPNDYELWEMDGNEGWGYDQVTKYFDSVEKDLQLDDYNYPEDLFKDLMIKSWYELGVFSDTEHRNEAVIGPRTVKLTLRNGKRLNTGKLFLSNSKSNLHIMKNTIVEKISIDSLTNTVKGVKVIHKSGIRMDIQSSKEVILSAGSIATPQILMTSGIGPMKHLSQLNIECIKNLPVGQNLQDHFMLTILFTTNLKNELSNEDMISLTLEYILKKSGPLSTIGLSDFVGFINTNGSIYPDIQFHHAIYFRKDRFLMKQYLENIGYSTEIVQSIVNINHDSVLIGINPTLLHPKSKGEILLSETNVKSKPIINANYGQDKNDMETMLKAIEFLNEMLNTSTFKSLGIEFARINIPGCSSFIFRSVDYWKCYIMHMGTTIYHPVGTVKMGRDPNNSVVNHNLMVHGIQKLRVVDASIMPNMPSANTMGPTLMIAEKAADILKQQYISKDEL